MFERIVVAYDGSEPAAGAAALAFRLGRARASHILLLHVIDVSERLAAHAEALPDLRRQLAQVGDEWMASLDALAAMAAAGTRIESRVVHARPAEAVLEALSEHRADLVAMGTHGVGGLKALIGSVSHKVVAHARCPVLLVGGQAPPKEARINVLAALDGSAHSLRALAVAQELALALGGSLRLVHVVDLSVPFDSDPPVRLVRELREEGRRVLAAARSTVSAPLDEVIEELREGRPREGLLRACLEDEPALLVMASRGIGGFPGLLIGSNTRSLVNEAPCPVLIARAGSA